MEHGVGHEVWLKDTAVFLLAAGLVVPLFKRMRLSAVLGFLIAGVLIGPYALGALADRFPLLNWVTVSDPHAAEPFAERLRTRRLYKRAVWAEMHDVPAEVLAMDHEEIRAVERAVPAGKVIHAIVDNYATHKHPKVLEWLAEPEAVLARRRRAVALGAFARRLTAFFSAFTGLLSALLGALFGFFALLFHPLAGVFGALFGFFAGLLRALFGFFAGFLGALFSLFPRRLGALSRGLGVRVGVRLRFGLGFRFRLRLRFRLGRGFLRRREQALGFVQPAAAIAHIAVFIPALGVIKGGVELGPIRD